MQGLERVHDIHPISPKTPAPQYKPCIVGFVLQGSDAAAAIITGSSCSDRYNTNLVLFVNNTNQYKKALALLLKNASPTASNTGSARSFQRDAERGTKVLRYCEVLQLGDA